MTLSVLLARLSLEVPEETIVLLERLGDELLRWNRRRNLTAMTRREDVLEKHLADSLTLLPHIREARRLLDLGSGAGFPALPLKIVRPDLEVLSVDSVGKKIDFQRHIARSFALQGFTARQERIEDLAEDPALCKYFDVVTARALAGLDTLIPLARPFLAPGGRLMAMKGPGVVKEINAAARLTNGSERFLVHTLNLPLTGAERCLVEVQYSPY